jgi:hypothetical protein
MVLPAFKRLRSPASVKQTELTACYAPRGTRGQRPVIRRGYQRLPGVTS